MASSQKGRTQLALSSLPTSKHPPSLSQRNRFPAPCCQIYGICTCKQQLVPLACVTVPRASPGCPPQVQSFSSWCAFLSGT